MVAVGRTTRSIAAKTTVAAVLTLCSAAVAQAQVGITSGLAKVSLIAYSAPKFSMAAVGQQRDVRRSGRVRETSVLVALSVNTGYQLIVRRTDATTSRVWVRASSGDFQELKPGSAVTVARGARVEGDREIRYRIESPESPESPDAPALAHQALPVRYEIAINPTL
jgi:hypothetical protein